MSRRCPFLPYTLFQLLLPFSGFRSNAFENAQPVTLWGQGKTQNSRGPARLVVVLIHPAWTTLPRIVVGASRPFCLQSSYLPLVPLSRGVHRSRGQIYRNDGHTLYLYPADRSKWSRRRSRSSSSRENRRLTQSTKRRTATLV